MNDLRPAAASPVVELLRDPARRAALSSALPAWIAGRRWYRSKSKVVARARVAAAFAIGQGVVAVVEVAFAEGGGHELPEVARALRAGSELYVVPMLAVHGVAAAGVGPAEAEAAELSAIVAGSPGLVVATLDGVRIIDALAAPRFLVDLLDALAAGGELADVLGSPDVRLGLHPLPSLRAARGAAAGLPSRLLAREQTNSSVQFGDVWVGKIVRKLDPGESADLEAGRILTAAGFAHTPALAGFLDVRLAPSAAPSTLALVHDRVDNRGDAWGDLLGTLGAWVSRDEALAPLVGSTVALARSAALDADAGLAELGAWVHLLGRRVGEMHRAFASTAAVERGATPEPLDRASREAVAWGVLTSLAGLGDRVEAGALAALQERVARAAATDDAGVRMRVHGDLHLGQVLVTPHGDFAIIDFEGEPARPLEDRKAKRSPLADVAGMMRSFQYAAFTAARTSAAPGAARRATWFGRAASSRFLRGWLDAVEGAGAEPPLAPRDAAALAALLDLFLLEKCLYEVAYELENRPDWVEIPLAGLAELAVAAI